MTRLLYVVATSAFLIGLAAGILILTDKDMRAASAAMKASALLSVLLRGLFACGVIAGLAGFISSRESSATEKPRRVVRVLNWLALAVLAISLVDASLSIVEMDGYFYDGADKASAFLRVFVPGLFYAGIIIGFATVISLRSENHHAATRRRNALYLAAVLVLGAAIAIATMTVSDLGEYASLSAKASFFLTLFLQNGVLYGGVLAGLAAYISSQRKNETDPGELDSGTTVTDDWIPSP